MKKFLLALRILQEVPNSDRKLGRGFLTAIKINPYNPLSYIFITILFLLFNVAIIIGAMEPRAFKNPFKWD